MSKNPVEENIEMTTIIQFPSKDEKRWLEIEAILDEVEFPSKEVARCVKEQVMPILRRCDRLPKKSFSLQLPTGVNDRQAQSLVTQIESHVKEYAQELQWTMLQEIVSLQVEICKLIHK